MNATDSFLDVNRLCERFNLAVDAYNNSLQAKQNKEIGNASRYLDQAGMLLGALTEHVLKNIVYNDYQKKITTNLSLSKLKNIQNIMDFIGYKKGKKRDLTTHQIFVILFNNHKTLLIKENMAPSKCPKYSIQQQAKIDNKAIRDQLVNKFKHQGSVPQKEAFCHVYREVRLLIQNLINSNVVLKEISDVCSEIWDHLYMDMSYFQPDEQCYVLITGQSKAPYLQNNLFRIPWSLIIDFDDKTEQKDGLLYGYKVNNQMSPRISILSKVNMDFQVVKTHLIQWLLVGESDSCNGSSRTDLILKRRVIVPHIQKFLSSFCSQYTRTISILVIDCDKYINSIKTIIDAWDSVCDGENISYHFLNGNGLSAIDSDSYPQLVRYQITTQEFLQTIEKQLTEPPKNVTTEYKMPGAKYASCKLSAALYNEVQDILEPIYIGIEQNQNDPLANDDEKNKFYKGEQKISWHMLAQNVDLSRDNYSKENEKIIREQLASSAYAPILELRYEAGVGATTYLRRLAYNLHRDLPTVFVHKFNIQYTISALHKIYECCQQALLLLIDGNEVFSDQLNQFRKEIFADKFPCVMIYAVRTRTGKNSQLLLPRLSKEKGEVTAMCQLLLPYIPKTEDGEKQKQKLKEVAELPQYNVDHIPFILSLYAFNKEFRGIKEFIRNTLQEAQNISNYEENLQILFDLALADYADLRLPMEYFDSIMPCSSSRLMKSGYVWSPLIAVNRESIYMKHVLFSESILQLLSPKPERISFVYLKQRILNFIGDSHRNLHRPASQAVLDMLSNIFTKREQDTKSYDAKYSKLITAMRDEQKYYSSESVQEVQRIITNIFEKLVATYPQTPHFYGHLARYYFYELKNFDKGFETIELGINVALENNVNPSTLYHTQGMGYVIQQDEECFKMIQKLKKEEFSKTIWETLNDLYKKNNMLADRSRDSFKKSIEEGAEGIYAQVAECNMRIDMHQKFYTEVNKICIEHRRDLICPEEILQSNLDAIDCLIDDAEATVNYYDKRLGEKQYILIKNLTTNRNLLNKNNQETIQLCKAYLDQNNTKYSPSYRRRLAKAYWDDLENSSTFNVKQNHLKEIIQYMEININAEPRNNSNYRLWFNAMRKLVVEDKLVEDNLNDVLYKLNVWIEKGEAPSEAYYYRFVTKFIILIENNRLLLANERAELLEDLDAMKHYGGDFRKRTIIRDWLGNNGKGLNKLIKDSDFRQMQNENNFGNRLEKVTGRLPSASEFGRTSFLDLFGMKVFFRPIQIQARIGISNANQQVDLCIGFSYDGLRAHPDSIKLSSINPKIEEPLQANIGDSCQLHVKGHNKTAVYGILPEIQNSIGVLSWNDANRHLAGYSCDEWPENNTTMNVRLSKKREWSDQRAWQVKIDILHTIEKND